MTINDATGSGSGAAATATVDAGAVTTINVTAPGTGYVSGAGIRKFVDQLPGLCDPAVAGSCPTGRHGAKYIPLGVPEEKTYNDPNGKPIKADEYVIGLVQYRTKFSSDLPATLVRGYVQIETPANAAISQHYPADQRAAQRHQGPGPDRRPAGLRRHAAAVARPDARRDQEQAGPRRLPQPPADRRRG